MAVSSQAAAVESVDAMAESSAACVAHRAGERRDVLAFVVRTTAACGVPIVLEDSAVIAQVAQVLR